MTQLTADLIDQINDLSNERQALWRTAGHKHLSPRQRERIQFLNEEIPHLWHRHRSQMAQAALVAEKASRKQAAEKTWMVDFEDSLTGYSGVEPADDGETLIKWQLVAELVQEVLYEERHLDLTLKEVLARRNETLSWAGGRRYPQRVPLHT